MEIKIYPGLFTDALQKWMKVTQLLYFNGVLLFNYRVSEKRHPLVVKLRCPKPLIIPTKEPFMSIVNTLAFDRKPENQMLYMYPFIVINKARSNENSMEF